MTAPSALSPTGETLRPLSALLTESLEQEAMPGRGGIGDQTIEAPAADLVAWGYQPAPGRPRIIGLSGDAPCYQPGSPARAAIREWLMTLERMTGMEILRMVISVPIREDGHAMDASRSACLEVPRLVADLLRVAPEIAPDSTPLDLDTPAPIRLSATDVDGRAMVTMQYPALQPLPWPAVPGLWQASVEAPSRAQYLFTAAFADLKTLLGEVHQLVMIVPLPAFSAHQRLEAAARYPESIARLRRIAHDYRMSRARRPREAGR